LNIEIKTKQECIVMRSIVNDYENMVKKNDHIVNEDFAMPTINDIQNAIDKFVINNSIGLIGPMECRACKNEWMAVCADGTRNIKCPKCTAINTIPQTDNVGSVL